MRIPNPISSQAKSKEDKKGARHGALAKKPSPPAPETPAENDRARVIFGNELPERDYEKACKAQAANRKKFGDDSQVPYHLHAEKAPVVGDALGVRWLKLAPLGSGPLSLAADATCAAGIPKSVPTLRDRLLQASQTKLGEKVLRRAGAQDGTVFAKAPGTQEAGEAQQTPFQFPALAKPTGKPVVVGNIRMGFGHYRIAMAMASAAHALGYVPYWFDLCAFEGSTCSKLVQHQNKLYSMGSRLSQSVAPFNALYWEPLNSEGFRKLSYNAGDQKNAQLMAPVYADLPKDVPFIGTHVWPAQAAVHAGLTHVVNAIPDNWPMALHLAEGALHTVQTPGAALGYRMLRGMDPKRQLAPIPANTVFNVGHYIDHELVMGIPADNAARLGRMRAGSPVRYLVCVGGAGAQQDLIAHVLKHLARLANDGQAVLMVNVGDHKDVWKALQRRVPALRTAQQHFDSFQGVQDFAASAMTAEQRGDAARGAQAGSDVYGIHAFCDDDIFSAVYSTNVLMRVADVVVTKPSELAFYPVPKLMIRRVGGHEAWGAVRAAEVGDGTYELATAPEICAMIDVMQADRSIVAGMCESIVAADGMGIYDGAYKAVQLAIG